MGVNHFSNKWGDMLADHKSFVVVNAIWILVNYRGHLIS